MKKKLPIFSSMVLLILGSSAIGGGWMLIKDYSGYSMELPIELRKKTLFDNYLIPGIILLVAVELFSIATGILTIRQAANYTWFLIVQGGILFIWLTSILILNIEFYHPLYHLPLFAISFLLTAIGLRLRLSWQGDDLAENFI